MCDRQPTTQCTTHPFAVLFQHTLGRLLMIMGLTLALAACGDDPAGNGTTDIDNNDVQTDSDLNSKSTTIPLTKDIRSFKQEFYDQLVDQCGTCHGAGQSPEFLSADVNFQEEI